MTFLFAGRLALMTFLFSFCLVGIGQGEEPKKEEEPRFPLTVRVFRDGSERTESYGNGKDKEALERLEKVDARWERQWALERISKAQIEQGRLDAALATIRLMQGDDDKNFGYPDGRTTTAEFALQGECLGLLAEAHAKAGRFGEAAALANRIVDAVKRLHAYRLIVEVMP